MLPIENPTQHLKRVLIIEDDEMIAGIYKRKFESAGFEVDVEMDGSDGYYRISKMHPDAVLLDLLLPGMNGPDIIRKFRAQRKFSELPIIAFTNAYLSDVGRDAVSAGATQVFNKATVTPQEIVSAVMASLTKNFGPTAVPAPVKSGSEEAVENVNVADLALESSFHPEQSLGRGAAPVQAAENLAQGEGKMEPSGDPSALPVNPSEQPAKAAEIQAKELGGIDAQVVALGTFIGKSGPWIDHMRQIFSTMKVEAMQAPKPEAFIDLARISHTMSCNAAIVGLHYLAHIAAALEALAWELFDNSSKFCVPTRQTIAKAIDMIARLLECGSACQLKEFSQFNVLVVDDHQIARKMITKTLDRAKLSHVACSRPELALELLKENQFDLVILDVKMDGMSGFELCTALRQMPHHQHCHVIFVSSLTDFQSRVSSTQAGGNDFVVKPFAPMELALKSLLHMVTSQLDRELIPGGISGDRSGKAGAQAAGKSTKGEAVAES